MFYPTTIIVWALWTLWCIAITAEVVTGQQELYAVVVDAGSTGSRGFVYKLRFSSDGQTRASISAESCGKVRPGLSSFVSNPEAVVEYFMPLIIQAKSLVPTQHLHDTALYIKGTAGMRILSDDEQYRLWQEVERGLRAHADVPFVVAAPNLGTISGHMEAFYAVLASNYIAGSIDADLM